MARFDKTSRFDRDWKKLTPEQKSMFQARAREFSDALDNGVVYPPHLRISKLRGFRDVYEFTWERSDGRATFQFADDPLTVIWRRIGTHDVFNSPM